ncbi:MAG: hypothetical protein FWC77_02050 [Defluviitaleaceae bacterium]|nr:hypothetical protein [Defluviitaleaceae bacterium]
MRCHNVQELFSEIFDGAAEEQAILVKHIQECPICAAEYEDYSRFINELRQLPAPELPANFHETIMAKVREIALSEDSIPGRPEFIVTKQKAISPTKPPQKRMHTNPYAAARRWASVAAAACLLLVSLWAMRVFDMPHQSDMAFEPAPMSAPMEFSAEAYDFPVSAGEMDFLDDELYNDLLAPAEFIESEPAAEDGDFPLADMWAYTRGGAYDVEFFTDEDYLAPEAGEQGIISIMPTTTDINVNEFVMADDLSQNVLPGGPRAAYGAGGIGTSWFIMAFAVGLLILCISLGMMFGSIYHVRKAAMLQVPKNKKG